MFTSESYYFFAIKIFYVINLVIQQVIYFCLFVRQLIIYIYEYVCLFIEFLIT